MPATNQTTNFQLPLFVGSDKPSWLGDWNGAMNKIDAELQMAGSEASQAMAAANAASQTAQAVQTQVTALDGKVTSLESEQGNQGAEINALQGDVEQAQSDIREAQENIAILMSRPAPTSFSVGKAIIGTIFSSSLSFATKRDILLNDTEGILMVSPLLTANGNQTIPTNQVVQPLTSNTLVAAIQGNIFNLPLQQFGGVSADLKSGYMILNAYAKTGNTTYRLVAAYDSLQDATLIMLYDTVLANWGDMIINISGYAPTTPTVRAPQQTTIPTLTF